MPSTICTSRIGTFLMATTLALRQFHIRLGDSRQMSDEQEFDLHYLLHSFVMRFAGECGGMILGNWYEDWMYQWVDDNDPHIVIFGPGFLKDRKPTIKKCIVTAWLSTNKFRSFHPIEEFKSTKFIGWTISNSQVPVPSGQSSDKFSAEGDLNLRFVRETAEKPLFSVMNNLDFELSRNDRRVTMESDLSQYIMLKLFKTTRLPAGFGRRSSSSTALLPSVRPFIPNTLASRRYLLIQNVQAYLKDPSFSLAPNSLSQTFTLHSMDDLQVLTHQLQDPNVRRYFKEVVVRARENVHSAISNEVEGNRKWEEVKSLATESGITVAFEKDEDLVVSS
ncbi:hypothetical protein T439DRAFT_368740 [Meredithblackwellia eburnea MCA 4105]